MDANSEGLKARQMTARGAEFKTRVTLKALKGIKPINQIAQEEGLHSVQVSTWKPELQARLPFGCMVGSG